MKTFNEHEQEQLDEAGFLRMNGQTYEMVDIQGKNGKIVVKAGPEGIMIDKQRHLSWENIKELQKRFKK